MTSVYYGRVRVQVPKWQEDANEIYTDRSRWNIQKKDVPYIHMM